MKTILGSRRDQSLARLSVFLVTAALIAGLGGAYYVVGGNTPLSQNLEIQTWYDLDAIRDNLDGNHILMNDLDSTSPGYEELASPTANQGAGWEPIESFVIPSSGCGGGIPDVPPVVGLKGTFDGQGYEIRDLFINRPGGHYVGLFGFVDEGGIIKNVGVMNVTVTGGYSVGGLVGANHGNVSNSYSSGNVTGDRWVGGLVGRNGDTVSNSYSTGGVSGNEAVGGLVGRNDDTVSECYAIGNVTGTWMVGGLVGENGGIVSNSYSTDNVTGDRWVGGLVGLCYGEVSDSYSTGNVSGNELFIGGLVGEESYGGIISNSYYNYDKVLINGESIITIGALFDEDFEEWLANDKFLDINDRLSQESGYYVVNNVTDFKELLAFGQDSSLKFRLKNDLDLVTEPNFYIPYFAGEFDGNSNKISNLSLDFDFVSYIGLFGCLASGGKVTDLDVENVNVTGISRVGGLVGANEYFSTVSNSYSSGSVTGDSLVGGLVGWNDGGNVSNSYSTCSVTGEHSVGGLSGFNCYGIVSNSYSSGNVTGYSSVGGLVGQNAYGTVSNSYSSGSVTGDSLVGGLVGENQDDGTVSNSFWDTKTSGQAASDGGTGKTTAEMQDIATFSGAGWDIVLAPDPTHIWNIVDAVTYPFLSWEP